MSLRCKTNHPYNSNKTWFCFFVKFLRGGVSSRDNRGVRTKGRAEDFNSQITNREQNHRTTP